MKASLNTRASGFAQDFDSELTRAYLLFQVEPMEDAGNLAARVAARYDRWQSTARHPRLIKDVYLTAADVDQPLQRFNQATRFLEPADWPASMSELRAQLRTGGDPSAPIGSLLVRTMMPPVWEHVPAVVVPTPVVFFNARGAASPTRSRCGARRLAILARAAGATPRTRSSTPYRGCRTRCCCSIATTSSARCCRDLRSSISAGPVTRSTIRSRSSAARGGASCTTAPPASRRSPTHRRTPRWISFKCGRRTSATSPPKCGGSPRRSSRSSRRAAAAERRPRSRARRSSSRRGRAMDGRRERLRPANPVPCRSSSARTPWTDEPGGRPPPGG